MSAEPIPLMNAAQIDRMHAGQQVDLRYPTHLCPLCEWDFPLACCTECGRYVLDERHQDIWRGMALGWSNQQIADNLSLTEKTVKNYASDILKTLGVTNRTMATTVYWVAILRSVTQEPSAHEIRRGIRMLRP